MSSPFTPSRTTARPSRTRADGRPLLDERVPARIVFLGLWDTVLALGSRIRAKGGTTRQEKRFHVPSAAPANVERVRHALAIDESRHDFQPEVFDQVGHWSLEQRWFAGAHSNVGGGLRSDGLANSALRWIVEEACDAGLEVRGDFLSHFSEFPQDRASTKSFGYKLLDTVLRPIRGFDGARDLGDPPGMTVDDSVLHRLNADPEQYRRLDEAYRPDNLIDFLAGKPNYAAKLSPQLLALLEARRSR